MKNLSCFRVIGGFLFKYRSFTPIPLIALVFLFFKPAPFSIFKISILVAPLAVTILGQCIRALAVGFAGSGTSGRESYFKADSLNRDGLYSIVRNPLYIGNILIFNGLLILYGNLTAGLIFNLILISQYLLIIFSEEHYLKQMYGDRYYEYLQQVNRLFPKLTGFRKPTTPFNLKKVIFKENDSVFNWLLMFMLIVLYKDLRGSTFQSKNNLLYIVIGVLLVMAYSCVNLLKKKSGKKNGSKVDGE